MEIWDNDDYETAIEEYPGYLGLTWDGEFSLGPEMSSLSNFDWGTYWELVEESDGPRQLHVDLRPGSIEIKFEAYDDLAVILDFLPSLTVYRDNGPPDAGPASGTGYIFFLADNANLDDLVESVTALAKALENDLSELAGGD